MLLRDLIVLDSFCMNGQGTGVLSYYRYSMNFGVSYFYLAPPLPHLNTCTTLQMNIP